MKTLRRLERACRFIKSASWLVCPDCSGPIVLVDGTYWCDGKLDGFSSKTLQPLKAVPKEKRS